VHKITRDVGDGRVRLQIVIKCDIGGQNNKPNVMAKQFAIPIVKDWATKLKGYI
jgi:hypothetical protein